MSNHLHLGIGGRNQPVSTLNNQMLLVSKAPNYHNQRPPKHTNDDLVNSNLLPLASLSQDARINTENYKLYEQSNPMTIQQIRN